MSIRFADAINVGQSDDGPFVFRKIDACNSCHAKRVIIPAAACVSDSEQMTRTTPFRVMTLQFSQRFFTDACTFIVVFPIYSGK